MKRLLLVSNSTLHGSGYLEHCENNIKSFLGSEIKNIVFIPFARPGGISYDDYTAKAKPKYKEMGYNLKGIHEFVDMVKAIEEADAVFIGGGNTFMLLKGLYDNKLIEVIRKRVNDGMPYIGTSAGSNVACPTIMTTNDMPIINPGSFAALNLFPYQINAHYIDTDPNSTHMGETRETRLKEFMVFNDTPIIALREGCMILCEDNKYTLYGSTNARVYKNMENIREMGEGELIEF